MVQIANVEQTVCTIVVNLNCSLAEVKLCKYVNMKALELTECERLNNSARNINLK